MPFLMFCSLYHREEKRSICFPVFTSLHMKQVHKSNMKKTGYEGDPRGGRELAPLFLAPMLPSGFYQEGCRFACWPYFLKAIAFNS